jgi:hypothetical protein
MSGGKAGLALAGAVTVAVSGSITALLVRLAGISWLLAALVALGCVLLFYAWGAYRVWDKTDRRAEGAASALETEQAKPRGVVGINVTGGLAMANQVNIEQPSGVSPTRQSPQRKEFRSETVRLHELIGIGRPPRLQGYVFDDCDVYGPAVIGPVATEISDCLFNTPDSERGVCIEVAPSQPLLGVIMLYNCRFRRCRFHQVNVAGTAEMIAGFQFTALAEQSGGPPATP